MGRQPAVIEITCTRYEVCTDIEEIDRTDNLIGQALRLLTEYNNPESIKQMNYIREKIRDHYKKGFIYYLDTLPIMDESHKIVGERVIGIYITEFGMNVQVNSHMKKTIVRPTAGYFRFDIINNSYKDVEPVITLFFETEPSYWYDDD